jgi:hypothetical protein
MSNDEAKRAILARRARFVAAAMVGAGIVGCEKEQPPMVCLSVVAVPPPETAPAPCLSVAPPAPPAPQLDAGVDPTDAGPPPMVCLGPMPLPERRR